MKHDNPNETIDEMASTLAGMSAAYLLLDRLAPIERWALARLLVAFMATRMRPGDTLSGRDANSLGPIGLQQLTSSLADRTLVATPDANGTLTVGKAPPSPER